VPTWSLDKPTLDWCRSAEWFRVHSLPTSKAGDTLQARAPTLARGIAFGGDTGVARVDFSNDGGHTWEQAQLSRDEGKYSFRQWQISFTPSGSGAQVLMVPMPPAAVARRNPTCPIGIQVGSCAMWSSRCASLSLEEDNMVRQTLPLALATVIAFAPFGAHSDDKLVLKSVTVDLPSDGRMFPGGPGSDAANGNCLACHSADMVLINRPCRRRNGREEVEKMRTAYKAPIDPKDVDTIVDYSFASEGRVNPHIQIQLLNIRLVTHDRSSAHSIRCHCQDIIYNGSSPMWTSNPIILVQLLTHTLERRHLGIFQSSIEDNSQQAPSKVG